MQRLSAVDTAFLSLDTKSYPMHGLGVLLLSPPSDATFDLGRLRALLAERLPLLPPLRRRVLSVPFGLDRPSWIEDGAFDLADHLRSAVVPAPGGMHELLELISEIGDQPLDMDRPLWECWLLQGLADGRVAIVIKMHHACADGMGGLAMIAGLFDAEAAPVPRPPLPDPFRGERPPSGAELLGQAALGLTLRPWRALWAVRALVQDQFRSRPPPPVPTPLPDDPPSAGPLSFNGPINGRPHRSFAVVDVSLADVEASARAAGATVNDVVLALSAGALRHYLADRGEPIDAPLVAVMPVNQRAGDADAGGGNEITIASAPVRVDLPDHHERLIATAARTARAKSSTRSSSPTLLDDAFGLVSPGAARAVARVYATVLAGRIRLPFHLLVSNIRGAERPLYLAGARLTSFYVQMMPFPGIGLLIVVMSYDGRLFFSITGTKELTPDVESIATAIGREAAALSP